MESIKLSLNNPLVDEVGELSGYDILLMIKECASSLEPDRWTEVCHVTEDIVRNIAQQVNEGSQGMIEQIAMMLMLAENCTVNALGYMDMLDLRMQIEELEKGEDDA